MPSLAEVSDLRRERLLTAEIDKRVDLLLQNFAENPADHYHAVTANPRSMGYLRSLLKYYAKKPHPFRECYKDNLKRFGPKTAGVCGVLKDTIRQSASWRGHPERDAGAPGVAIGEADKGAAPPFGGKHHMAERSPSLLDELDMEFGVVDHSEPVTQAGEILLALEEHCDVYRVLIGLDEPPTFTLAVAA